MTQRWHNHATTGQAQLCSNAPAPQVSPCHLGTRIPGSPSRAAAEHHATGTTARMTNDPVSHSTGKGEEHAGILSSATKGSETPCKVPPPKTESHTSIDEGSKTHTPNTTQCGVVPQLAGSIPLRTNEQAGTADHSAAQAARSSTTVGAVRDTTQARIDACKQEWTHVTAAMQESRLPSVVQGQAAKALLTQQRHGHSKQATASKQ